MSATAYYVVASVLAMLTIVGHVANYIVTLRVQRDLATTAGELKEYMREQFVSRDVCDERHDACDDQLRRLETRRA